MLAALALSSPNDADVVQCYDVIDCAVFLAEAVGQSATATTAECRAEWCQQDALLILNTAGCGAADAAAELDLGQNHVYISE